MPEINTLRLLRPQPQSGPDEQMIKGLSSMIERYRTYCIGRGETDASIKGDAQVIQEFYRFVGKPPANISKTDYEAWSAHLLRERKLSRESVRKYQAAIRKHLAYLLDHPEVREEIEKICCGKIVQVATKDNSIPKSGPRREKEAFSREEIAAFFAAIDKAIVRSLNQGKKSWWAFERDKCMFYLAYFGAMRPDEVINLVLDAFRPDPEAPHMGNYANMSFLGKAPARKDPKLRTVQLLSPDLVAILDHYLSVVRPAALRNHPAQDQVKNVFLSERGKKLSKTQLYNRFHLICELAGLPEGKFTPHCHRVSFATHLERLGVPKASIQQVLGHEYLHTTLIYTRPQLDRIQADIRRIRTITRDGQGGPR